MHIMLEGVVPYELKLMLTEYVTNRNYFTVGFLNDRIACFPYSSRDLADKPVPISDNQLIAGSKQKFHQSGKY